MPNVLIAGHRGFIGVNLTNFFDSKNISYLTLKSDLLEVNSIEKEIDNVNEIGTLIFLVGTTGSEFNSLISTNLITLNNLLTILVKRNLKNVIFASTGGVYGEPEKVYSFEKDSLKPNSLYGLSKKYSEELLNFYSNAYGFNCIILRFPNVYGPGNKKGVIYNFLKSIAYEKKVILEGTGDEKRNFLFVEDAVESIYRFLNKIKENKIKNQFNIYNVSNSEVHNLFEVIDTIKDLGFEFDIVHNSSKNYNPIKTISLSNLKIKSFLNWIPRTPLKEGIKKTILVEYSKI